MVILQEKKKAGRKRKEPAARAFLFYAANPEETDDVGRTPGANAAWLAKWSKNPAVRGNEAAGPEQRRGRSNFLESSQWEKSLSR
jgi:hypothetical protein